jgi:hypothetical protein
MAGFVDSLRMATGVSLTPQEAYQRAFEKGVLLGPGGFVDASQMFRTAAEKLAPVAPALAARAAANAALYRFLGTRDQAAAHEASARLAELPMIEVPGTADEAMPGRQLATEIGALALEMYARSIAKGNHREASEAFSRAAQAWRPLLRQRLVACEVLQLDAFTDEGMTRFFLTAGLAEMHAGAAALGAEPEAAAERFAMAAQAFARCGAGQERAGARQALRDARFERACWFCQRRVQGLGTNLVPLAIKPTEYLARASASDRERGDSYDGSGRIFACAGCASAVDRIAEVRVDAVRAEMRRAVADLERRLGRVESMAHKHAPGGL